MVTSPTGLNQILREVSAGTGATAAFGAWDMGAMDVAAADKCVNVWEDASLFSHILPDAKASLSSIGLFSFIVGTITASVIALTFSYRSITQSIHASEEIQSMNARLSAVSELTTAVGKIEAAQKREGEALKMQAAASRSDVEQVKLSQATMRQSIDRLGDKFEKSQEEARQSLDSFGLRLNGLEESQVNFAATSKSLQARFDLLASVREGGRRAATSADVFHLMSVKEGKARIAGPTGVLTVSIGDSVPGLGKVSNIEVHGRNGSIVAERGSLKTILSRRSGAPK